MSPGGRDRFRQYRYGLKRAVGVEAGCTDRLLRPMRTGRRRRWRLRWRGSCWCSPVVFRSFVPRLDNTGWKSCKIQAHVIYATRQRPHTNHLMRMRLGDRPGSNGINSFRITITDITNTCDHSDYSTAPFSHPPSSAPSLSSTRAPLPASSVSQGAEKRFP